MIVGKERGVAIALFIFIALAIFIAGCTRIEEKVFTPIRECRGYKILDDPNDFRDDYDNCILNKQDLLQSKEGCENKCVKYCTDFDMNFNSYFIDFNACHCYCAVKIIS